MLVSLSSRSSYLHHLDSLIYQHMNLFSYRLHNDSFRKALSKMITLDVDAIIPLMKSYYSYTGRPAKNQMEILRSFILASHFNCLSIEKWVNKLRSDVLLAIICGFVPGHVPAVSSFYDFINRFYIDAPVHRDDHVLEPNHFCCDNSKKPKRNEKLENYEISDTVSLYDQYKQNDSHASHLPEYAFLQFFDKPAVQFSLKNNLITQNCTAAGDGSSLHTHSNSHGTRIDDDHRRYSDLDANFG